MNQSPGGGSVVLVALVVVGVAAGAAVRQWSPTPAAPPAPRDRYVAPLFDPADAHRMLDDPKREKWQHPKRVVEALGLRSGASVADVGTGSGYLLPYLSRAVGATGTVYAQEIQDEYLPALQGHAKRLRNVQVVMGTAADPKLPPSSVDCFVLLTVYHEVQNPTQFLRTLQRAARPRARLAILDFDAGRRGYPPAPIGHEVAEADVVAEAQAAGWVLEKRHEFLSSQFFLVFRLTSDKEP